METLFSCSLDTAPSLPAQHFVAITRALFDLLAVGIIICDRRFSPTREYDRTLSRSDLGTFASTESFLASPQPAVCFVTGAGTRITTVRPPAGMVDIVQDDLMRVGDFYYNNPWEAIIVAFVSGATGGGIVNFIKWLQLRHLERRREEAQVSSLEIAAQLADKSASLNLEMLRATLRIAEADGRLKIAQAEKAEAEALVALSEAVEKVAAWLIPKTDTDSRGEPRWTEEDLTVLLDNARVVAAIRLLPQLGPDVEMRRGPEA